MPKYLSVTGLILLFAACRNTPDILYKSTAYSIYSDRVLQDSFQAKALSPQHIISNYKSPANALQDANIVFKFSINGKDNEMLSETNHHVTIKSEKGKFETPLIVFGEQYDEPSTKDAFLKSETGFTIRLDMRPVLQSFETKGFFTNAKAERIYKEDFKAVYVAGNILPMTWDFDNLKNRPELELKDADGDGIYETTLLLNAPSDQRQIDTVWQLSKDISAFPQYQSPHVLADAIYNMALEEMENAVEKDSTLRTGKEWAGVWTRDVSYSIILSMAYMQPQVAMNSLRRKVNARKRIIQDTGTGGAWPVSTDRMIWAAAAWEIYLVTGNEAWLKEAYEVIKNSLFDDYKVAYDETTGLVKGESSFLDWREQTYPKWMQPADIFESECLGTNAAHFQANTVAAHMARILNDTTGPLFLEKAVAIKNGINKYLWSEEYSYYGQYRYGRVSKMLSPRSEALGEALSVVFNIADPDRQKKIVASTPLVDFGIPCIYPQIPSIPPYHNNGIWPFVQTFWLWAGAKAKNEQSVMESIAAIYRPSALFLTNKENFVAASGDFSGTVINSSNMLWSLSGNISLVHKVLFGIRFSEQGLAFDPFVPAPLQGKRYLKNFRYRNAVLDIEMTGFGDSVSSFTLDGQPQEAFTIPANLSGLHSIKMVMNNKIGTLGTINKVPNTFSLSTPMVRMYSDSVKGSQLNWDFVGSDVSYQIFLNSTKVGETKDSLWNLNVANPGFYQVIATKNRSLSSFASEPLPFFQQKMMMWEAEDFAPRSSKGFKGFSGKGFVEINQRQNRKLAFEIEIEKEGNYVLGFRYANGNGPINTENKCALRSLYIDDRLRGGVVFPQRGTNEWSDWGYSNYWTMRFLPGKHRVALVFENWNENMNGEINQAMIDALVMQPL